MKRLLYGLLCLALNLSPTYAQTEDSEWAALLKQPINRTGCLSAEDAKSILDTHKKEGYDAARALVKELSDQGRCDTGLVQGDYVQEIHHVYFTKSPNKEGMIGTGYVVELRQGQETLFVIALFLERMT